MTGFMGTGMAMNAGGGMNAQNLFAMGQQGQQQAQADDAFAFLQRMLELGADVALTDHYGRNCLMEAVSEANNLCPVKNQETGTFYPGRPITPEMCEDLQRIFRLLIDAGADRNNVSAFSGKSIREHYESKPVRQICGELWAKQKTKQYRDKSGYIPIKIVWDGKGDGYMGTG